MKKPNSRKHIRVKKKSLNKSMSSVQTKMESGPLNISAGIIKQNRFRILDYSILFILFAQYLALVGFVKLSALISLVTLGALFLSIFQNNKAAKSQDLIAGWISIAPLFLLNLCNAQWILPKGMQFPNLIAYLLGIGGFFILWYGFRSIPNREIKDLTSFQARLLLLLLIILGGILRMRNADLPFGNYWMDQSEEARDPRNILDLSFHSLVFAYGARGPLFTYLVAVFWKLFPDASSLLIIRIVIVFVDLASLWLFYLLGKEFDGKRRTGIFFASMGAVSRQMILKCFLGTYAVFLPFFVALDLLLFFKLIKKPDLRHFIFWIVGLSLGNYVYVVYRPWTLVMILIVLAWVLLHREERKAGWTGWLLASGIGIFWILYFMDSCAFFPEPGYLRGKIPAFWLIVFLLAMIFSWVKIRFYPNSGQGQKLSHWGLASCLGFILVRPMFDNTGIFARLLSTSTVSQSILHKSFFQSFDTMLVKLFLVFQFLFYGGRDESSIGIPSESFFDFYALLMIALGIVAILSKPSLKKAFLAILVFISISPCLVTEYTHSARLLGCLVPFYLIGAIGLNQLWESCQPFEKDKGLKYNHFLPLFLILLAMSSWTNSYRANNWYFSKNGNVILDEQIVSNYNSCRLYVCYSSPGFTPIQVVSDVLCEKGRVFTLSQSNPIYLSTEEKGEDVGLLFTGGDIQLQKRIQKDFPRAQWSEIWAKDQSVGPPFLLKVLIPFDQITEDPGKAFYIVRVLKPNWLRRLYDGYYGLGKGVIIDEDRVNNPSTPFRQGFYTQFSGPFTSVLQGEFKVSRDGNYLFTCKTSTNVNLNIDGSNVLDIRPGYNNELIKSSRIHLVPGSHEVEIKTYDKEGYTFPLIRVQSEPLTSSFILGTPE